MKSFALSLLVLAGTLALIEGGLHLLLRPSASSYGKLWGQELPPLKVVLDLHYDPDFANQVWPGSGHSNPDNVTYGDLWGVFRQDPRLGYVNKENTRSLRGWWQSNNIGANSRVPTAPAVPRGRKRVFVFGDSFGRASRIRMSDSWSAVLQSWRPGLELVNMSVDAYGAGQAYLRFQSVAPTYDYDAVVFILPPETDLWRDVNTMRYLAVRWDAFDILPRFVVENDQLRLVPGPYEVGTDIYRHDLPTLTDRVRDHLRKYDPFYLPLLYESPPVLGRFLIYKIAAGVIGEWQRRHLLLEESRDVDSEGMRVERKIFRAARQAVEAKGKRFFLVLLPDSRIIAKIRAGKDPEIVRAWEARAQRFQEDGNEVIDLMPEMRALPKAELDSGFDQTHYGPRTNRALAGWLDQRLGEKLSWWKPAASPDPRGGGR